MQTLAALRKSHFIHLLLAFVATAIPDTHRQSPSGAQGHSNSPEHTSMGKPKRWHRHLRGTHYPDAWYWTRTDAQRHNRALKSITAWIPTGVQGVHPTANMASLRRGVLTHVHTHRHVLAQRRVHAHMHAHTQTREHTNMHTHMHTRAHTCAHTRMHGPPPPMLSPAAHVFFCSAVAAVNF